MVENDAKSSYFGFRYDFFLIKKPMSSDKLTGFKKNCFRIWRISKSLIRNLTRQNYLNSNFVTLEIFYFNTWFLYKTITSEESILKTHTKYKVCRFTR